MAFDENLTARIHTALARKKGVEEKKMFGGVGFLLNGNLLVDVRKDSLFVWLGSDEGDEALLEPHVREFDITRRPMKNSSATVAGLNSMADFRSVAYSY
jgi:TfoX-like protein